MMMLVRKCGCLQVNKIEMLNVVKFILFICLHIASHFV